jgi:hypothetical protein
MAWDGRDRRGGDSEIHEVSREIGELRANVDRNHDEVKTVSSKLDVVIDGLRDVKDVKKDIDRVERKVDEHIATDKPLSRILSDKLFYIVCAILAAVGWALVNEWIKPVTDRLSPKTVLEGRQHGVPNVPPRYSYTGAPGGDEEQR